MNEKSELEAKIAEAEVHLKELKEQRELERERLQHAEIERLEEHLSDARVRLSDLKPAAAEAWSDLRKLIEALLADLRRVRDEFKRRS
jgi:hypothetical protein